MAQQVKKTLVRTTVICFALSVSLLASTRGQGQRDPMEVWKFNRQVPAIEIGTRLRIQADSPFLLHWTTDEWLHSTDTRSTATGVDIEFVDVPLPEEKTTIRFTFLWIDEKRWEGKDYKIELQARGHSRDDEP